MVAVKPSPIRIFVINLDRRADRMGEMMRQLQDIPYTRIAAVDGRQLADADAPVHLTINEFACIQSHLKALRIIAAGDSHHACILEDDVQLSRDFATFMAADDWLSPKAGIVKIETMQMKVWLDRAGLRAAGRRMHRLRSTHFGTAGYVISRAAAQDLIAQLEQPSGPIDHVMFRHDLHYEGCRSWQLCPALCIQDFVISGDCSGSDIAGARHHDLASPPRKLVKTAKIGREIKRFWYQIGLLRRHCTQRKTIVEFA